MTRIDLVQQAICDLMDVQDDVHVSFGVDDDVTDWLMGRPSASARTYTFCHPTRGWLTIVSASISVGESTIRAQRRAVPASKDEVSAVQRDNNNQPENES